MIKFLALFFILVGCTSAPKGNYRYPDYSYVCSKEEVGEDCIIYDKNVERTSDHYFKEWERLHSKQRPEL